MALADRAPVQRVRAALERAGVQPELVELAETARSAGDAARALGCPVEAIVKSLLFRGARSGRPVLVLASGPNRVDERLVAERLGEPIEKADARFVRERSGFAIGGVPPVGHAETPVAFVDRDLLDREVVWAAAGHTHVVFGLDPAELSRITGGQVIEVTAG